MQDEEWMQKDEKPLTSQKDELRANITSPILRDEVELPNSGELGSHTLLHILWSLFLGSRHHPNNNYKHINITHKKKNCCLLYDSNDGSALQSFWESMMH